MSTDAAAPGAGDPVTAAAVEVSTDAAVEVTDAAAAAPRCVPMRSAHLDAVLRHEPAMFGAEAWSRSSYLAELADVRTRGYLALEDADGALLGWGGILVAADTAEITTIGIVPPAQGRGLGRMLLHRLAASATARGARELFLEVRVDNDPARRLYERAGFVEVGRRRGYYDHGRVDAVVMRAELPLAAAVPAPPASPVEPACPAQAASRPPAPAAAAPAPAVSA